MGEIKTTTSEMQAQQYQTIKYLKTVSEQLYVISKQLKEKQEEEDNMIIDGENNEEDE